MTGLEEILGAAVLSLISGGVGKYIGDKSKVAKEDCATNRAHCNEIVCERLGNIEEKIETLTNAVNNKIFGV